MQAVSLVECLPLRYRLERYLGHASGVATLQVFDTGLRQTSAVVKCQRLGNGSDGAEIARGFLAFCAKVHAIHDAHVAAPYTYGTFRGPSGDCYGYTTREFVPGAALAELRLPLDEPTIVRAALQICRGLDVLHGRGLVHGDVKPENIVVRRAEAGHLDELSQCVLIDLNYRPPAGVGATTLNDVTLQYVAPELTDGAPGNQGADLFSLGVLLYRGITGDLPYPAESMSRIIRRKHSRDYVPIHAPVHPQLRRTIQLLLEPNPENRPDSAQAVIALLEECGRGDVAAATPLGGQRAMVFVGRDAELTQCLDALRRNVSCVEITAPLHGGTTAFLRELQDRVEMEGAAVLTARPRERTGLPIPEQLFEPVHELVRRTAREEKEGGWSTPGHATALLDDLSIAAAERRVILFVDDWTACDSAELAFLTRLVRQGHAQRLEHGSHHGHCELVLGCTQEASPVRRSLPAEDTVSVRLAPLETEELEEIVRLAYGGLTLTRADVARIRAVSDGRPGAAREILDTLAAQGGALGSVLEARALGDDPRGAAAVRALRARPAGDAQIVLALWGERLPHEQWSQLVTALAPGADPADCPTLDEDEWVRSPHAHLHDSIRAELHPAELGRLVDALLRVTRSLWRTHDLEQLAALLRSVIRLGGIPRRARWHTYRALMVLMRHGRFADVEAAATALRSEVDGWLPLFELAARVEAGHGTADAAEPPPPAPASTRAGVYARWIRARGLWRARFRREALTVLEELLREGAGLDSGLAVHEDYGSVAAELGLIDEAAATLRTMRAALAGWYGPRALRKARQPNCARKVARFQRVRSRILEVRGRFAAAAAAARRERRLHAAERNLAGCAASLNNEGVALVLAGRPAAAVPLFEKCIALRERVDDERGLVVALNNLALGHSDSAELSSAAAALNRARVIAHRNGLDRHRNLSMLNLCVAYERNGQLRDAARVAARLLQYSPPGGDDDARAHALFNYIWFACEGFYFSVADRHLPAFRELVARSPALREELSPEALEAQIALLTRDWQRLRLTLHARAEPLHQLAWTAANEPAEIGALWKETRGALAREERLYGRLLTWVALEKKITRASVRRLVAVAERRGQARVGLGWLAAFLRAGAPLVRDEDIAFGLDVLERSACREGHDDLQIEIRALLARILFEKNRAMEARGLVRMALQRFRRLEQKLQRWGGTEAVLPHLAATVRAAVGGGPGGLAARCPMSASLVVAAFQRLLDAGAGGGARSRIDALRRIATTLTTTNGDAAVDELLALAVDLTGAERGLFIAQGKKGLHIARSYTKLAHRTGDAELSWAVVSQVLASGAPAFYDDALAAEELASHRSISVLHLRSLVCVPLLASGVGPAGGAVGTLYLDHSSIAGLFREDDLDLLQLIACVLVLVRERTSLRETAAGHEQDLSLLHGHVLKAERGRMAGLIASGVVHDLRNLVTMIVGYTQLSKDIVTNERVLHALETVEQATSSMTTMLDRLLECVRDHESAETEPVDLGRIARETLDLVAPHRRVRGTRVRTKLEGARDVFVRAVPGEVRELFLNLILNACDAMPNGGELRIDIESNEDRTHALIAIADTGVGMTPEIQERLFEPFFTTKGTQGTGLGLAVVHNVIVRYGGEIDVDSTPGEGTTFRIRLPLFQASATRIGRPAGSADPTGRPGRTS